MAFRKTAVACATAASLLGGASAYGQGLPPIISTAGDDSPIENGALSAIGSLVGGLRIDASLNTLYDSNLLRVGDSFPPRPGLSKSDVRISPAVTASFGKAIGRQEFFASGNLGRDFYLNNSSRNRNSYGVNAGLNWRLGTRCSGDVSGRFSSRQQLFSEISIASVNVQEQLSYGGSAICRTATGIGFGASIRNSTTRNNSIDRAAFDTNSMSISPQLSYGNPTLGQFSLSGSFNQARYPSRFVITGPGTSEQDGVDIMSGRFGYQRGLGGRLSVNFGVSYFDVTPKPADIIVPIAPGIGIPVSRESQSNLGYDVGVSYDSGSRLTADITGRKSAQASINVGAQYQVVQAIAGNIGYRLNRAIAVTSGISYTQRDYRNSFSSVEEPALRLQDKISRIFAGLSYSPGTLYSVSGDISYQDRKSNPDFYSFKSFAATLRLRAGFGGRG